MIGSAVNFAAARPQDVVLQVDISASGCEVAKTPVHAEKAKSGQKDFGKLSSH